MAMLIVDCARCGAKTMTHDLLAHSSYWGDGDTIYEFFACCRNCQKSTIWEGRLRYPHIGVRAAGDNLGTLNEEVTYLIPVRVSAAKLTSPQYTPEDLATIFREGAECLANGCWNAAGAMFRKIVDKISKERLPPESAAGGPDKRTRFNLKPRLEWLFTHNLLPHEIKDFADCIREDANDAVHNEPIGEAEAQDLGDFTIHLLERVYTMPGRLEAAAERRAQRRGL